MGLRRTLLGRDGLPIVWIALTLALLFPVWHARLLPMLDTPNHLALVRGWHSYNDPSYGIAKFYELRIRLVPYFLYYGSVHLLMYVFPIEVAHKIFLSAYLILFPLSVLSLTRAFGRSRWLALGAFPLSFNQNWIYGFTSYLMSTTLMFFATAALVRLLFDGKRRDAIWLGVLCLLCYLGHVMPWFVFGCCAIALLVRSRRAWRRRLAAGLAMLPSLLLAISGIVEERSQKTYLKHGTEFVGTFRDVPTAVMEFPGRILEIMPGHFDMMILSVLAATTAVLVIGRRRASAPPPGVPGREELETILVVLALCYLSLPYEIARPMSWWYVSPRVPSMMAVFLLLLPSLEITGWRRALMLPLVVASLALPIRLGILYRDFSDRNAPFMTLLSRVPRGATTLVVVKDMWRGPHSEEKSGDPVTSSPAYWHFSSYPMALNGGYSPYVFDQGIPIRPKRAARLLVPSWTDTDTFEPRSAPDFEYYIVRYAAEEMNDEPSIKTAERIGDWTLYKRMVPQADEPAPAEL